MRSLQIGFWCALSAGLLLATDARTEEPPAPQPEKQAAALRALLLQLSAEDYTERQAAFENLLRGGAAAREALAGFAPADAEAAKLAKALRLSLALDRDKASLRQTVNAAWPGLFGALETGLGERMARASAAVPGAALPEEPKPPEAVIAPPGFKRGGSKASLAVEELAVNWLAAAQEPDGRWNAERWGAQADGDLSVTALAQMALLSAGGPPETVSKAQRWLLSRLNERGRFKSGADAQAPAIPHALALWACIDCAGLNRDAKQLGLLESSVQALSGPLLNPPETRDQALLLPAAARLDLFTAFFTVGALRAARRWGLPVNAKAFDAINERLTKLMDAQTRQYRLNDDHLPSAWATVLGCAVERMTAGKKEATRGDLPGALKQCLAAFDVSPNRDALMEFVCQYAAFREGGDVWKDCNERHKQRAETSWVEEGRFRFARPQGEWRNCGRVFSTAQLLLGSTIYVRSTDASILTSWQRTWAELSETERPGK